MKTREGIELQKAINNRTIPCDMYRDHKYWSESKQEYQDFLDMDLIHVIRALSKTNNTSTKDKDIIEGQLSRIKNHVDNVRVLVNSIEEDIKDG